MDHQIFANVNKTIKDDNVRQAVIEVRERTGRPALELLGLIIANLPAVLAAIESGMSLIELLLGLLQRTTPTPTPTRRQGMRLRKRAAPPAAATPGVE